MTICPRDVRFFLKKYEKFIHEQRYSLQSACGKSHKILSFYFFCIGRIAQLVERLSYTQVVIGSSPVAPKSTNAGVVQLVRALPCHGRSCGFKSRLPRILSLRLSIDVEVSFDRFAPNFAIHIFLLKKNHFFYTNGKDNFL